MSMSPRPKISFVLPVRNRANLIKDALESLITQTEPHWEAIIVDDGSRDNLKSVIQKFQDERMRYYRLPRERGSGVAAARNYGNLLARTELIAVLDSDDVALPSRATRALDSYERYNWDFYSARRMTEDIATGVQSPAKVLPESWDSELFKTSSYVTHSSVVYTKQAAMEIPYNSALPCLVDYDLITRFISSRKKIYYDTEVVVVWRRHDLTLTNSINQETRRKYLAAIRGWRGWIDETIDPGELA